jgi:hypothetical protein
MKHVDDIVRRTGVRFWPILVSACVMLASGCGGTPAPTPADPAEARATLDKTLSSWQHGETTDSLKKADPSVTVSDMKWDRGSKLTKYEINGSSVPSGAQQKFRVTLWLTDAKGKETKDVAHYEVGTYPIRTVFRSAFE